MQAEIVWQSTSQANTFRAYKDFYDKYPNTTHAEEARAQYESQWKKLCAEFYSEGELSQMDLFAKQYPSYPVCCRRDNVAVKSSDILVAIRTYCPSLVEMYAKVEFCSMLNYRGVKR